MSTADHDLDRDPGPGAGDGPGARADGIPSFVDPLAGGLTALVGLAVTAAGLFVLEGGDRAAIERLVAEGEVQGDLLTEAQLVDVLVETAWWTGVGLVLAGLVTVLLGVGYVVRRRRERRSGSPAYGTGTAGFLGAVVAALTSFIPLSPVIGGALSGYLTVDEVSGRSGATAGAVSGLWFGVPTSVAGLAVAVGIGQGLAGVQDAPGVGFVVVGATIILLIGLLLFAGMGALGGYVGGLLTD